MLQVAERRPRSGLLTPGSRRLAASRQPPRHRSSVEIGRLAARGGSVEPSRLNSWVVRDANGHALVDFEGNEPGPRSSASCSPHRGRAYCRVGFDGRGLVNKTPLDPLYLTREGRMGLVIGLFIIVAIAAIIVWVADYTSVPRGRLRK